MRTGCVSRSASLIASLTFVLSLAAPVLAQDCPELVGWFETPLFPYGLAVSGGYAYVASSDHPPSGLYVIDVSVPSAPVEVGFVEISGIPRDVAVSGGYAYIADHSEGLRVIAVRTPSAPVDVGYIQIGGAFYVAVSGGYAYVEAGLHVIDVTTPSAPVEVGFVPTGAGDVAVLGSYAYVAAREAGLRVIDVSDPTAPFEVGFLNPDTLYPIESVAVSGGYAYVSFENWHGPYGLYVIDASSPTAPVEVGFLVTGGIPSDVAVSGDYVYDATSSGLYVIDVSTPSAPVEIGFAEWFDSVDVAVSDGYVFLAAGGDAGSGLYVFRECGSFSDGFESGDTSAWTMTVP